MKVKCRIKIGIFALIMFISLLLTSYNYFIILLFVVILHELGHVFMAKLCHIRLSELKLSIFGAALSPSNTLYSYKDEILLCIGGPLSNFVSALIVHMCLGNILKADIFVMSSLALGIINLLPIIGFDGGRITLALLSLILGPRQANGILKFLSFMFIFILWLFSVYLLIKIGASLTLFIFSLSLFTKIFIPHAS